MDDEICKCQVIHQDILDRVTKDFLEEQTSYDLSEFFKVLGDNTRIKIIYALSKEEMCVCDIGALLNMSQSAVSHQLKVLRQAKAVKPRKQGKIVYYSLTDEHIRHILEEIIVHIKER